VDVAGGSELQLPVEGSEPSWSPDGQRLAFSHGYSIFTVKADGSDIQELGPGNAPTWWP
jgi:Tol biopolymer transport system component